MEVVWSLGIKITMGIALQTTGGNRFCRLPFLPIKKWK